MDLNQLNNTLTGIENALLRRKVVHLEGAFDELDEASEELAKTCGELAEAYEIEGQAVDTSAASGGKPGEEAYQGYTVGNDGDRKLDNGATKTSAADKAKAHAKAMEGGPDDKGTPQTTTGAESRAHSASSKSREDRGDIDHGHA